jgi:hypothetical protein
MRRLLRSSPAVAAALFAATWVVSEQLAGLGTLISLALAGVVTVSVVPWLVVRTPRRPQALVRGPGWDIRPGGDERPGAQQSGTATIVQTPSRHTGHADALRDAETFVNQYVRIAVDGAGFEVRKRRKTAVADGWDEYLRMQWSAVAAIKFATDRHDPVVALYLWTASGERYHVVDSGLLSRSEWAQLSMLIAESTGGRLALDLTERENRSALPDS